MNKEELNIEDILNATGSMFDTMFDYVDSLNKETKQLEEKDKEIERLSKEVGRWNKKYNEQLDIINELEKYLENWEDLDLDNLLVVIRNMDNKLKELKKETLSNKQ